MQRTLIAGAIALCCAMSLAACGGGGGGNTIPTPVHTATAAPTQTPSSLPSPAAQQNTASISPSSTQATTSTLPATGGITPTVTVPQLSSGSGTLAVTIATGGDATMARVHTSASRRGQALPGGSYLLEFDFVPSANMTFNSSPGFSLDVTQYVTSAGLSISQAASMLQGLGLYAGFQDGSGNFAVVGPLTVTSTGTALTISYTGPAATYTMLAGQHYDIGVHLGPISAPTATPTGAPTATPTVAPTATPTVAPTATPTPTATATPNVTYYSIPTASSYPSGIALGPDGAMWFTEWSGNAIGRIAGSGGSVVEYASGMPGNTEPSYITSGANNDLFFTGYGNGCACIGNITTSGTITDTGVPQTSCQPYPVGLTIGPDGNLWFTDGACSQIGVKQGATITMYTTPGHDAQAIASGSDGNLWFTDYGVSDIGTMTTAGTVSSYAIPTKINCSAPQGNDIVAGPDLNLWFTDSCGRIGKVATDGTITMYAIPSGNIAEGITVGGDGNLWFAEQFGKAIGKITTLGVVTEYALPDVSAGISAAPYWIAGDRNGDMWFTDNHNNVIGEFVP